jgi:Putative prokaryotic signal transducing protein
MEELIRTNDLVLISFVEALLKESEFSYLVADQSISAVEGSIGLFPRRILIFADEADEARALLIDAGLEAELRPSK